MKVQKILAGSFKWTQNRGAKNMLILCADGLSGIKESIAAAYPTYGYPALHCPSSAQYIEICSGKRQKSICKWFKEYIPCNRQTKKADTNVCRVSQKMARKKYPNAMRRWEERLGCFYHRCSTTFSRSQKSYVTTNAIESLNSVLRRLNSQRSVFRAIQPFKGTVSPATELNKEVDNAT